MSLVQRARDTGKCPPSLLSEDRVVNDDGFQQKVLDLLEPSMPGMTLGSDESVATNYEHALKMAEDVLSIPGDLDLDQKRAVAEHRRCILLALLACTSPSNPTLKKLLSDGLLVTVKSWLDDILNGAIGSVDLLLHLLSSLTDFPVTKSMVVDSGMGKAIRDIEKHKICAGTANEAAIKARVKAVKDAWNASVKVNKDPDRKKRKAMQSSAEHSPKKKKTVSAFSSLVKKVSTSDDSKENTATSTSSGSVPKNSDNSSKAFNGSTNSAETKVPKKSAKRVKWADHFGGNLDSARQIDGDGTESSSAQGGQANVSWSDRKKRDRLREKELLAKAKKAKIIDDDDEDEDSFSSVALNKMKPTIPWHQPKPLPDRSDIPKAQCASKELTAQNERRSRVVPARYLSEEDVPSSPFPMTDIEETLDVASQASTVTGSIPFFAAQQAASAQAFAPGPAPAQMYPQTMAPSGLAPPPPPPPPMGAPMMGAPPVGATAETLQAMGLPLFLVGSNVQALQTLAQTPSLLSTFVDANGQYDQPRVMSLVQALTQNLAPSQQPVQQAVYQQPMAATGMNYGVPQQTYQAPQTTYGTTAYATAPATSHYGLPATTPAPPAAGYRSTGDAGNLHVSGYGPTTTQAEIIAFFTPYVRVDEVVMKPNFSFVNTSDPDGATRAREALNGALLGGTPIRINPAQRRNPASAPGFVYGGGGAPAPAPIAPVAPAPVTATGEIDVTNVRDDRGNPATKNLFVAGYGPGTTEQQIRDFFSQYCTVTGCVLKGTFAFVNTSDRAMAVKVRETLSGAQLNGGPLRINFAKETGRLGTSFDTTYGPNTGSRSHYMRPVH